MSNFNLNGQQLSNDIGQQLSFEYNIKIDEITPQFGDVKFEVRTIYFKWQVRFDNSVGNCARSISSRWIDSREFDISIGDALRQPK